MYYCNGCNKKFDSNRSLQNHLRIHKKTNNINIRNDVINDYVNNYMTYKELREKYKICLNTIQYFLSGVSINISERNKKRNIKPHKHTEETKKIISKKRKEYLKNNPNKHVWKRVDKFISEPCEKLKNILKENKVCFIEEYSPLDDRFFSIDISFPNIKLGLEINGNQHYNKKEELKKYYEERKKHIEKTGWKLIDIHYSKIYDDTFVDELLKSLKNDYNLENIDLSFYIKNKKQNKYKNRDEYFEEKRKKYKKDIEPIIEKIKNSDIDFSKFGWVKEVSEIIGCHKNRGGHWMKKNMIDFYNKKCKKRKVKYKNDKDYYKNPKICPNCSKILEYNRKDKKFCNRSCASTYNNSKR